MITRFEFTPPHDMYVVIGDDKPFMLKKGVPVVAEAISAFPLTHLILDGWKITAVPDKEAS